MGRERWSNRQSIATPPTTMIVPLQHQCSDSEDELYTADSPMSTSSDRAPSPPTLKRSFHHTDSEFSNKRPRFPTKYDEQLQPLSPVTTLPVHTRSSVLPTSSLNSEYQTQLKTLVRDSHFQNLEEFLERHSEKVDVNQYMMDGNTPVQHFVSEGKLQFVKLLVRFGANMRLTNRDGFSLVHLAAFAGHTDVMMYVMRRKACR